MSSILDTAEFEKLALIAAGVNSSEIPSILDTATWRQLMLAALQDVKINSLSDVGDVLLTDPETGQVLTFYNGTWINQYPVPDFQIVTSQVSTNIPPFNPPHLVDGVKVNFSGAGKYFVECQFRFNCPSKPIGSTELSVQFAPNGSLSILSAYRQFYTVTQDPSTSAIVTSRNDTSGVINITNLNPVATTAFSTGVNGNINIKFVVENVDATEIQMYADFNTGGALVSANIWEGSYITCQKGV